MRKDWGVTWQDMFGCLTQLSFMNWGNLPEKIESGPALMATGQAGDLLLRGVSNVVTDSGQSMSKTYVVKRVDTLTKEIRSLRDLTLQRSQFLDPNNLYNDTYKLTLTRDQFKELCNDFTNKFERPRVSSMIWTSTCPGGSAQRRGPGVQSVVAAGL